MKANKSEIHKNSKPAHSPYIYPRARVPVFFVFLDLIDGKPMENPPLSGRVCYHRVSLTTPANRTASALGGFRPPAPVAAGSRAVEPPPCRPPTGPCRTGRTRPWLVSCLGCFVCA